MSRIINLTKTLLRVNYHESFHAIMGMAVGGRQFIGISNEKHDQIRGRGEGVTSFLFLKPLEYFKEEDYRNEVKIVLAGKIGEYLFLDKLEDFSVASSDFDTALWMVQEKIYGRENFEIDKKIEEEEIDFLNKCGQEVKEELMKKQREIHLIAACAIVNDGLVLAADAEYIMREKKLPASIKEKYKSFSLTSQDGIFLNKIVSGNVEDKPIKVEEIFDIEIKCMGFSVVSKEEQKPTSSDLDDLDGWVDETDLLEESELSEADQVRFSTNHSENKTSSILKIKEETKEDLVNSSIKNIDRGEETYYNTGQNWGSSSESNYLDLVEEQRKETENQPVTKKQEQEVISPFENLGY